MPEVSFYVLSTTSPVESQQFACKLIEKVYRSGFFPYILTDSIEQSQQLDNLLWTFRQGSFIPHQIFSGELPKLENVILIGTNSPPEHCRQTIINLSSHCPQDLQQAERILEILYDNEEVKAFGRQRYRQYQQAGIEITTHNI